MPKWNWLPWGWCISSGPQSLGYRIRQVNAIFWKSKCIIQRWFYWLQSHYWTMTRKAIHPEIDSEMAWWEGAVCQQPSLGSLQPTHSQPTEPSQSQCRGKTSGLCELDLWTEEPSSRSPSKASSLETDISNDMWRWTGNGRNQQDHKKLSQEV
jgi:hypothetical protein